MLRVSQSFRFPASSWRGMATDAKAVQDMITSHRVLMFAKTTCGFCRRAEGLFADIKVEPTVVQLNQWVAL